MNDIVPYNEYLLVEPDGRCRGFTDYEGAKAYINVYYERYIDKKIDEDDYYDRTDIGGNDSSENICRKAGVEIGVFSLYKIEDFIKKVNLNLIFEDEKKEVISETLKKNINFNAKDYNLDLILADIEKIDIMEPYGEH